ncbi:MAG: AAA family ATPase [Pseudomonadota bacterium]
MSDLRSNLLLISSDEDLHGHVKRVLEGTNVQLTARQENLTAMNGKAHPLAAGNDIVIFDTDDLNEDALSAIREICERRAPGGIMIALASEDLPLSKQRELKRVGADEVLPREHVDTEILPQIEEWQKQRNQTSPAIWTGQGSEAKIISVAQARGGLGASTFAVNLADGLLGKRGRFGKKGRAEVALVDLDFQFGTIAAQLDVRESDALWRMAMEGTTPDASFVSSAVVKSENGLSVLTAPSRYGPLEAIKPEQIAGLLDALRKSHDYIVVDLPHALVDWIEPVLSRSDCLMLTTDVTVPSVRATRKLMDFFLAEHPELAIQLVAVHEKKPLIMGAHHKAAMELLDRGFDHWLPSDRRAAREALDIGKPLNEVSPRSALAKAVTKVAQATRQTLPPRVAAS